MIRIEPADIRDAEVILDLQKLAYQSEARIYNDFSIPPLHQSPGEITAQFADHTFLKAYKEINNIIGSVQGRIEGDTCFIGRLIVHPDYQNQGIGTRLMTYIEKLLPSPRYELFTGHLSARNLYLYKKLGYHEFKRQNVTRRLTLVFLEKTDPAV